MSHGPSFPFSAHRGFTVKLNSALGRIVEQQHTNTADLAGLDAFEIGTTRAPRRIRRFRPRRSYNMTPCGTVKVKPGSRVDALVIRAGFRWRTDLLRPGAWPTNWASANAALATLTAARQQH